MKANSEKENNLKLRHLYKTISWRVIATTDTFIISLLITGKVDWAAGIATFEILTKMVLYYIHERIWFRYIKIKLDRLRHLYKTISWRVIATTDTFIISLLITGKVDWAAGIATFKFLQKWFYITFTKEYGSVT